MSFNSSNSKCLVVLHNHRRALRNYLIDCVFSINGQPMEQVESVTHLGHVITACLDDDTDIAKRTVELIRKVNNMICFLGSFRRMLNLDSHVM